jgi:cytochrome c-type biogenesis protein CcmE
VHDVSERVAVPPAPRRRAKRTGRWQLRLGVLVVAAACGALLYQGLSNATTYFYTTDQAVAHRSDLGMRRFRIEGVVVLGSIRTVGTSTLFSITNNGVSVDVVHTGGQPTLFKPDIPVVLEGHWDGSRFASNLIMVRHTAEYRQQNPSRVKDYPS